MNKEKIIEKTISLINRSGKVSETFIPQTFDRVSITKYHFDNSLTLESYNSVIAVYFNNERILIIGERKECEPVWEAIYSLRRKIKEQMTDEFLSI